MNKMFYVYIIIYFFKFVLVQSAQQKEVKYYLQFSGKCNASTIDTLDDCQAAATYLQNVGFLGLNKAGGSGYDVEELNYYYALPHPPGCVYYPKAYRNPGNLKHDRKMWFVDPTSEKNGKTPFAECGTTDEICICKNKTCAAGTYQDEEGQYECKECPSGYFSTAGQDSCGETCPEGTFGNSKTNACDVIEGNTEYAAGVAAVQAIIDDPQKYLVEQKLVTLEDGIRESNVTAAYDDAFKNATQSSLNSMTCNDLLHNYTQKCTCGWYDNDFWK